MARNLVLCCDGTWNSPIQSDRGFVVPTNVVKMARALEDGDPVTQPSAYYDRGIGTSGKLDRWLGGALGTGLSKNIQEAYQYIADHYQTDDRLFLFGFSRGAYTVRSLAGLIGRCGLTPAKDVEAAARAYELYRQASNEQGKAAALEFKNEQRQVGIHFLGVWDTVGALGVPALSRLGLLRNLVRQISERSKYAHSFHDETLGEHVAHAYQALAIDEKRGPFQPSLWKSQGVARNNVEQVWFAGVHRNVGGGYVDAGLSDHAFMWMAVKAMDAGLKLDHRYLAIRVDPHSHGELRDSMSPIYRLIPRYTRQIGLSETLNEWIHQSAVNRMHHSTNDYRPDNLVQALEVTNIPGTDTGLEVIERIRAASSASKWAQPEPPAA